MKRDRRFKIRENTNVPILYAKKQYDSYYPATLYNVSMDMDGMYFESNQMFFPGEYIFIKINASLPGFESGQYYDACAVQVKWHQKTDVAFCYKVGVKRVGKATFVKKEDVDTSSICCELCEKSLTQEIIKTDEHLYLCRNCFTSVSKLPGSRLKSNLNRFMLGNVI